MNKQEKKLLLILMVICVISLISFIGLSLFNTRGEPREAIVSLSMLKYGNWILPINNGIDIAYKTAIATLVYSVIIIYLRRSYYVHRTYAFSPIINSNDCCRICILCQAQRCNNCFHRRHNYTHLL